MRFRAPLSLLLASYSFALFAAGGQPNPPSWPTDTVTVFTMGTSAATVQAACNLAAGNALADNRGYALLFQPGVYSGSNLLILMAQFGSIMGLGVNPGDTTINDVRAVQTPQPGQPGVTPEQLICEGSLNDHWKSAENFTTTPAFVVPNGGTVKGMCWAGSQGCYMRKVVVNSTIFFSELINNNSVFYYGAGNGMFCADCSFQAVGTQQNIVYAGAQGQVTCRNVSIGDVTGSTMSPWNGGKWNQVLIGCSFSGINAQCGNCLNPSPTRLNPVGCLCRNSLCCAQLCNPTTFDPAFNYNTCYNGCYCDPANVSSCQLLPNPAPASGGKPPCTQSAFTIVDQTPVIAEKPYIVFTGNRYYLAIPPIETNKQGSTPSPSSPTLVDFNNVYVARPGTDTAQTISAQLNSGNHVIMTPGLYTFNDAIRINEPNVVLLGIGFPMIVGPTGDPTIPKIFVGDVDGVRVGGILFVNNANLGKPTNPQAPVYFNQDPNEEAVDTNFYIRWGSDTGTDLNAGFTGAAVKSGFLYDCFARFDPTINGGESEKLTGQQTVTMLQINSPNIVCDNVWLWRNPAPIYYFGFSNVTDTTYNLIGARMLGDNITAYGLICDNAFGDLLQWIGANGSCYSYQGLFPFDQAPGYALNATNGKYKYAGYLVNSSYLLGGLTNIGTPAMPNLVNPTPTVPIVPFSTAPVLYHTAYGVSIYSNFFNAVALYPENGISTGTSSGIQFVNCFSRYLGGQGGIGSVINGQGYNTDGVNDDTFPAVCRRAPGPSFVCTANGATPRYSGQQGPQGACPGDEE